MRKNTYHSTLIVALLLTIAAACRKQNSLPSSQEQDALITQRFFALPANAPDGVKALAAQIQKQNDLYHFVPKLVAQNGYPLWSKIKASNETSTTTRNTNTDSLVYLLPFSASTTINAYLFCKQTADSFQLKLNNKQGLLNQLSLTDSVKNKRLIAKLKIIAWMEKTVNNKDSILFNHPLIGGIKNANVSFGTGSMGRQLGQFADVTICGWQWNQPTGWVTGLQPGQAGNYGSWSYGCTSYTIWINGSADEYLEENQTNGGDGWWMSSGGGLGLDAATQEALQAADWDNNIIVDSTLRPCFRQVLDSIRKIQPGEIAKIIKLFSGTTPGFKWRMAEVNYLANTADASATTNYDSANQFAYTLFHKPTMPDATNLFHAAIIIHEAVHAYLFTYFYTHTGLSPAFKDSMLHSDYSKQFENFIKLKDPQNNPGQHALMLAFRGAIKDALKQYCIKIGIIGNIDEIADDLSWMGFQKTYHVGCGNKR
jgi:hypothetical protein